MERSEPLFSLTFCSMPNRLKLLRCVIRDAADMCGLDAAASDQVVLAVNEACMNIIQHAYGMQPDGRIDVTVIEETGAMVIHVRDYADRVDVEKISSRDLDDVRPGGLGVHLIHSLMDECGFLAAPPEGGNLFEMKKFVDSGKPT